MNHIQFRWTIEVHDIDASRQIDTHILIVWLYVSNPVYRTHVCLNTTHGLHYHAYWWHIWPIFQKKMTMIGCNGNDKWKMMKKKNHAICLIFRKDGLYHYFVRANTTKVCCHKSYGSLTTMVFVPNIRYKENIKIHWSIDIRC